MPTEPVPGAEGHHEPGDFRLQREDAADLGRDGNRTAQVVHHDAAGRLRSSRGGQETGRACGEGEGGEKA